MSRKPWGTVLLAAICLAAAALSTGCGTPGTALPGEIDVRTLDSGSYPVNRHSYDQSARGYGAILEGQRMAEAVVPTVRIDSKLNVGRQGEVFTTAKDLIEVGGLSSSVRTILDNREFLVAYAASGADKPDPPGQTRPDESTTTVNIRLLRFPSADTAKLAAREMEDADFNVALTVNRKLTLPEYPDAFAHWRPGVSTVGVVMARREFVLHLFIRLPSGGSDQLLSWAKRTLDAQVPLIDAFQPTPTDEFEQLRLDPDNILARALVEDRDAQQIDPHEFAVYGPTILIHNALDQTARQKVVTETGTDAVAVAEDVNVMRTRDPEASKTLIDGLITSLGDAYANGPPPDTIPDVKCVHRTRGTDQYRCYIPYKRYVAIVNTGTESDAHRMATAQYALLANSL
ncbi:hypothetical protein [Nocardia sp. NPDC050406]|uniref:DUF7373 family lipoprotein n=1 Tax=Nocardia sp. NPDC050406 TaxID=3364318 RepID=UPI0037A83CC3